MKQFLIILLLATVASAGTGYTVTRNDEQPFFEFIQLYDTPVSYTGAAGQYVAVNSGGTALEFVELYSGVFTSGSVIYAAADGSLTETNPGFTWLSNILGITGDIDMTGDVALAGSLIIETTYTPASIITTGTTGTIAWDSSYIYVCTSTNSWKRVAIATWGQENVIFNAENVIFAGEQVVFP